MPEQTRVTPYEHPLARLQRAALEYSRAVARARGADIRRERWSPGRRADRAAQLWAKATIHESDCLSLLQSAATAFVEYREKHR